MVGGVAICMGRDPVRHRYSPDMNRYQLLADALGRRIEQGLYRPGERLPSVRALAQEHGVSLATVQQAYRLLEDRGLVEPRPKSGYFVRLERRAIELPRVTRPARWPVEVSGWEPVRELMTSTPDSVRVQLGRGLPDTEAPTLAPLLAGMARLARRPGNAGLSYDSIQGVAALREQVARLQLDAGCVLTADDIVITSGAHEALATALRATCQEGDIVAVDSPTFHGVMQTLKGQGLKALEIPTDPRIGISLPALELALEQWPVRAIQLTPSCNNPLGYCMPEANKRQLVALARKHDLAVIEDDVYGDLLYGYPRARALKAFDEDDRVILCSSFSKTLAPGLRVGWVAPGRYAERILHLKYIGTGCTAPQPQLAIAEFIAAGHYTVHVRRMRAQYQRNRDLMSAWVQRYFPAGTRVSQPQGSFLLWVELPEACDSHRLNRELLAQSVQIACGSIFSASGKYRNCLRLNYAQAQRPGVEEGVRRVGEAACRLLDEALPRSVAALV
ncbi:GntR family transcriptional regulator [Pseudomonas oryzihabitans]|uniref:GntR family transcriptional regulator n=2 Tax=Pseudomonas oryzihabitans TaxID=47885 RepID=A0A0U4WNL8_9PSED|nr:GntR family transcriptional regulator [Pseudomonas oryzihabitans]